jgi:AcrR family transcriptional regulator
MQPDERQDKTRKQEIVDAARRLFAERGYEGASMSELAERVRMRKASLFYHFATKDALYAEVVDGIIMRCARAAGPAATDDGSIAERIQRMVDACTRALTDDPDAARIVVREAMDEGCPLRGRLVDRLNEVLGHAEQFVRQGQERGEIVSGDPKQLVLTAIGAHAMAFALQGLVEKFVGAHPTDGKYVEARQKAIGEHVKRLLLVTA